ncbi:MAG: hypothetical protein ACE5JD_06880 [Candidatus Methylomirabilia bacterium]
MPFLSTLLLRILKVAPRPGDGLGLMSITIRAPYAYLEEELRRAFQGQENVKVIVDRRHTERRTSRQPVPLEPRLERRRTDRRRPREELVEVVLWG